MSFTTKMRMKLSGLAVCLFTIGVLVQVTQIMTCDPGQASGCPSYSLVLSTLSSAIPIPDPEDLDATCRNLHSFLGCMLGPAVLGDCSPHQRVAYTAMSKVLNIPCHRYKQEYLMSSTCWKSTDLTEMVRNCFLINAGKISTNFCSGGQVIRTCIISDIKMLPGCDISSQRILDIMVTTWYNTVGIVLQPTCPELAVSSLTKTTSVANSEGWTSQAGQHEESTSSGDNLQPPEYNRSTTTLQEIALQLVDGPNPYEGRVEILKDGVWLSVCHQYVSSDFGRVVCRQLSYPTDGAVLYYANSYGQAPGEILREYINCTGEELSLSKCSFSPRDQNCDPRYTLGVSCDTGVSEVQTVRLVNGTSQYEGRVEVFKAGVWGSVTASRDLATRPLYSALAAIIVCRTLFGANYSGSAVPQQEATLRFGSARSAIHMSSVRCQGDEQNLLNCTYEDVEASETPEDTLAVLCKQVPEGCNGYVATPNGTITSPGFPEGAVYSSDTDCVWTIVNKAGWIRLSLANIQIETELNASVKILRVIDSDAYSNLAYILRPIRVGALQSSGSTLYLWLNAQSETKGVQFKASWETPPCFQRLKRRSGYIQSPDYPNPYQPNLNCTYEFVKRRSFIIRFSFEVFSLGEQQDGVCQDVLQIFDGDSESSPTVGGPLCGSAPLTDLKTRSQNSTTVLVRFTSDAVSTSAEGGYRIHYYQLKPGRIQLGNYTEDSGTFTSPGYPDVYNGEEDVIWTITTKPYKTITLTFHDLQLGPCCRNKIFVTEKPVHKRTKINKSGSFSTIISGGNKLRVKMVSAQKNLNKLKASWTTECRQVFQTPSGIINSPDDPDFNKSSADCTYIIRQQQGYYINLLFSSLNLEEDATCTNYIEVHDGATEFYPLLGEKYCGLSLPPPLTSTQNEVFIKFSSQTEYNNFSLTYSSYPRECDKGLMTDREGNFTSPGFPLGYPSNTYCVWTIRVDDYEAVIDLSFTDFSVGSQGLQCQNAFVRVYDGAVVDRRTVMATLCGSTLPQGLMSTRNSLTVVLNVFGSVVKFTGFRATYSTTRLTGAPPEADML